MTAAPMRQPATKYVKSGGVSVAYQVVGDGPADLVFVPGILSHLELWWEEPVAPFFRRLASFARLILFDKRGSGLSDRVADAALPTLEERMDDVRAVMDAVGSRRAALFGVSEGTPMSALFAATYPERTSALILFGAFARSTRHPDYPWGWTPEIHETFLGAVDRDWGTGVTVQWIAPTLADDPYHKEWWGRLERLTASPGSMAALWRTNMDLDVRHVLPSIHVPTLVLHRSGDRCTRVAGARYIADRIPSARFVEYPGVDHFPFTGDTEALLGDVEEFVTGVRHCPEPERVLATMLFIDIVGSTERAVTLGDARWRDLLGRFHEYAHREVGRFRGRLIDTAGDGALASFDGPARAVRCACAIRDGVASMGLRTRGGAHTGECEVLGDKLAGVAVHIAARIAAMAGADEILVSSTVRDLVAGSGLRFADHGTHALRGVPDDRRLFRVQ